MADCDNDQECEKIVPTPIKPEPLPKQCSGGDESGSGTNDFNELENRPKYGGRAMTGNTNIPEVETYEDFVGTDGEEGGAAGLVPAPEAADAGKFLKADGTWADAGGGSDINVVQTVGTSPDDVMSQNAATSMVFADPGTQEIVRIGKNAVTGSVRNVAIGYSAYGGSGSIAYAVAVGGQSYAPNPDAVALGGTCNAQSNGSVAIGRNATVYSAVPYGQAIGYNSKANRDHEYSVALGAYASTTRAGEVNIGTGNNNHGYDNTDYRIIGGVHDGQDAHDAATVGQLSYRQKKPVTVWEVDGTTVTTGLVGVGEDISANPNWQLTNLDLTPFARIKIYSKAAQKAGATASASTTPAIILEMSLDPRAAIAEYGGNYVGSVVAQKPNDANRLCTLCCAVSADKTKFEVLRMTNLYGTAATSNSDVNAYVFKIEGYYE